METPPPPTPPTSTRTTRTITTTTTMPTCKSLYVLCLEFCIPRLETYSRGLTEEPDYGCKWIENLAGPIVEDLLNHAFQRTNSSSNSKRIWKTEWKIFFTTKISSAVLAWDADLINYISDRCQNLRKCEVVVVEEFLPDLVLKLPSGVTVLDFDGELVDRGQMTKALLFEEATTASGWLPQTAQLLRALRILRAKPPPDHPPSRSGTSSLCELHLGNVKASAADLKVVLASRPNLRLLRHYQMVTALYQLHCDRWKAKQSLPKYGLKNLDVDFSHVVRCRMSPEWVISPDALQLAVLLCPSATSIKVRFDCSTPHDVLTPLVSLDKISEFSAVCVSSGERTLLDFSDMTPIFEKHGETGLTSLELKVIEEVEIHVIIENCTKLDTLVLSGCGYVTPSTCSTFGCHNYPRGSLKRLRTLLYADGDDFSWDHGVPECFWKATLCPAGRSRPGRLQGLFLEFPRMTTSLVRDIFRPTGPASPPFPDLAVLSFCRFQEVTVDDVASLCGLSQPSSKPCRHLQYVRFAECEAVGETEAKKLRRWFKDSGLTAKVDVET